MKILLLMDPAIPVPPIYYGGIERVVYNVALQYTKMGHEVTLIAGPNSKSPGRLIMYGKNSEIQSIKINFKYIFEVAKILYIEIPKHDVIHNFGRLAWMFPIAWSRIRKVQTYMRYISPKNIEWLNRVGVRNIVYTAVSDAIVKTGISGGGEWRTIYNCAPVKDFTYTAEVSADAPLVFLGRLERCKGAHTAIKVAKLTNRKLIIAGNLSPLKEEQAYFENEIKPHIDGDCIKYIGVVDNYQKNQLFSNAAAMLLPVEWFEPFPIVLPESYACGTPILAFPGGGVKEGIFEGKTGFLSNSVDEMSSQVSMIGQISRSECRKKYIELYSDDKIATDYLSLYKNLK